MHKENFKPLSVEEERTGKLIVNAAYVVHKALGPGLLEKVYEVCFCHSAFVSLWQKIIGR